MAQETGTQILSRARTKAQDNDTNTSNYAVSDATALEKEVGHLERR